MRDNLDKLRIELYGDGKFQGYLKSVSMANQNVKSTMNKMEAKTYSKEDTAYKDIEKISHITRGILICKTV